MVGVLVVLGLLTAGVLIHLASLPAEYQVRRSLVINVAPQVVFDRIRDLSGWKEWSPWLIHEPDAKLSYSETPSEEGGMPRLTAAVDESSRKGAPFTACHRVNPKTRKVSCDMAIPVGEDVAAGEFVRRELGGGRFFKVTLYGDYRFLELVWYSAMGHLKMCKLRYDGSWPALEVYENDPASVEHRNALHTTLYLPLK